MLLKNLLSKNKRIIAGLMSGTSLDGIDVTIAALSGSGTDLQIAVLHTYGKAYPEELRERLLRNSLSDKPASVREISQLNTLLPSLYAEAVQEALAEMGKTFADLDLIGSHGQTIHHVPQPETLLGRPVVSTLQIGDGSFLANLTGVPVVCDFRTADMAFGGQGAPLVPYLDYVMFSDREETRLLLNLGGIANITFLKKGGSASEVLAFDTGPANMVINGLVQHFYGLPWDPSGKYGAKGQIDPNLLHHLLADPYFQAPPPKSTGREVYNATFIERLISENPHLSPNDLIATATAFTTETIFLAYQQFLAPLNPADVLVVSGGGVHNQTLMHLLAKRFAPVRVCTLDDLGVSSDGKEALCFAVLAHEYLNETPTNLPSVTGASRPTYLGKLCLPAPLK